MKNLLDKLTELEERDLTVVSSRGSLSLQQTQRNEAKAEILDAIYLDVKESLEKNGYSVFMTGYGPVIEFLNDKVEEQVLKMDDTGLCSGFISVQLDAIMKNLDTNAEVDQEDYLHLKEQKELRAAEKERAKQAKTQRDAEIRAEKARLREETIARLQAREEN
jgi:hypothetical protein